MTGTELCSGQGSFFGRAGTFTADGNGNITAGLEDVNACTGVETIPFTDGTYSIDNYSITLSSATAGSIVQTDVDVTASGLVLNGDGTQANTLTVNAQTSPASAFNFTVYVVSQDTLLLVGVDTDRVVAGTMTRQP
jgi:hypothetical protein